ncbi:MAG: hypothetical protein ACOY3P_19185 [Planctomycetota bacterium]
MIDRFVALVTIAGVLVWAKLLQWTAMPLFPLEAPECRRPQFTISDLLCLMLMLQPAMVVATSSPEAGAGVGAFTVGIWWAGVRALARIGIRQTSRRCAMLLLWLPGFLGSIVAPVRLLALTGWLWPPADSSCAAAVWATLQIGGAIAGLVLATLLLRPLARWIAAGSATPSSEEESA